MFLNCRQAGEGFFANASQQALQEVLDLRFAIELLLHGQVAKDMDAIFRRSAAFAQGHEHLMLLAQRPAATADDTDQYVDLLGQVAESAAAGAIQGVAGGAQARCWAPGQGAQSFGCSHALMSRFTTASEVQAFRALPPCAALLDAQSQAPLDLLADVAFHVEPANEGQSSTSNALGSML